MSKMVNTGIYSLKFLRTLGTRIGFSGEGLPT